MYSRLPNLVLAFHGTDMVTFEKVLYKHEMLDASNNDYDWLGNGIYFWEESLERAWQWANEHHKGNPAVIGAVIDLGKCLNLSDSGSTNMLKTQFEIFKEEIRLAGTVMPENKLGKDRVLRRLDCAVIESLHKEVERAGIPRFDSVRGVFFEGSPIYEGSSFMEKTHVQLCVRNPNCIKGYFAPMSKNPNYIVP